MKKENKALARQRKADERRKAAQRKKFLTIGGIVLAVVLVIGIAVGIKLIDDANSAPVTLKYSKYLDKDGKIKGIDVADYVELCNLKEALHLKAEDVEPTDKDVQAALESAFSKFEELNKEAGTVLEDGDKINLDYVGYVDGKAFQGGDTKGNGTALTLGSGRYIDDFEEQLVGHKVGDKVSVNVTFPEKYDNNPDLASKDAVFEVVINGVYEIQITDELVAKEIEGYSTVAEYREALRRNLYDYNLNQAVWASITGKSRINEYPEKYTENMLELVAYTYQMQYVSANQSVYEQYGQYGWATMEDYFTQVYGMDSEAMQDMVTYYASSDVTLALLCEAIYEQLGLTFTEQEKIDFIVDLGYEEDQMEEAIATFGENYIAQGALQKAVDRYVMDNAEGVSEK